MILEMQTPEAKDSEMSDCVGKGKRYWLTLGEGAVRCREMPNSGRNIR